MNQMKKAILLKRLPDSTGIDKRNKEFIPNNSLARLVYENPPV
jgi:hypothetical protein